MNTVIRATDPAEFLGLVPTLAGFTPRQSIVLLPFQRMRAHGAMRIDLPDDDVDLAVFVDTAIGLIARVPGVDAVAMVVYTDEEPLATSDGLLLPQSVVIEALLSVASSSGLRIVEALCTTPKGWADYFDEDPVMRALDEIPAPPELPGAPDISGDQAAGVQLPEASLAEKERVGRALRDLTELLEHTGPEKKSTDKNGSGKDESAPAPRVSPQALDAALLLDDLPLFYESVLEHPDDLPPFVSAALLWCLDRPMLRDAAVLQWATDLHTGSTALDAQLAFVHQETSVPPELGDVFIGRGVAPEPARLRTALDAMRTLAASAPRAARPGPLTVAAWLAWALGRSTHAAYYLDAVAEIDPEHRMAGLLQALLDRAVLPEWSFQHRSDYPGAASA